MKKFNVDIARRLFVEDLRVIAIIFMTCECLLEQN